MRPLFGLFIAFGACCWAEADFGLRTKHSAKVVISRPPDAMLRGKSVTIKSREGVAFNDRQALELAVERSLSGEFTPSKDGKDIVLTLAVSGFEPVTARTFTVTEKRNVKVGKKTQKALFSDKMVEVDDIQERDVPVQYWEARGSLGLQITAHDSSGALVDSFNAQAQYLRKIETAENGVSKNSQSLPTPSELQGGLISKVASDLQKRYTKTAESLDVRLTVDEPLRPGNAMAMSGQWKEALATWKSAQMKKNPGDRAYNMAVAYEALAYQAYDASRNPDDAASSFTEAVRLYEEALRSDPKEKFFRQAMDRCAGMKANFARAKDQYATQQRQAEIELAKAEEKLKAEEERRRQEEERKQTLESTRADTQDEADFRTIVRGRLRTSNGDPDADAQAKLVQMGKDAYKLQDLMALRVVYQESNRLTKVRANIELYKQTFSDLVGADKTLDANDRGALTRLAQRLELSPEDIKPIEGQFQYQDLTAPPPAPPVTAAKPKPTASPKPVQAAKPAAAPKPQAPATTPPKPAAPPPTSVIKK